MHFSVLSLRNAHRDLFVFRYALDIIGTLSFGLNVNTLDNPSDKFRIMERNVNNGQFLNTIRLIGLFLCPK